jgi:hypothetical protein
VHNRPVTTQRGGDAGLDLPDGSAGEGPFTRSDQEPDAPGDHRPPAPRVGTEPASGPDRADAAPVVPDPAAGGRHQWSEGSAPAAPRDDGFDPSDTGTWRVTEVVPGGESGRRTTTILRYLLGLLAVDHVRTLTRWWFVPAIAGIVLFFLVPRWIGVLVFVLGVLVLVGRIVLVRAVGRLSLARRYRPVENDLRAAVEAGKANLRSELRRVGLPSGTWTLPLSAIRLARGTDRSAARSRLREVEIHRILPDAQLTRALRVLDQAAPGR